MKRVIYVGTFLALVGITIAGCKKDVSNPAPKFDSALNIATDGRMLIFKTSEDYSKIIDDRNEKEWSLFLSKVDKMKHTSYAEVLEKTKTGENLIGDENLSEILNDDWVVQIGDYLYRVNKPNESVFVLPAANISEYDDLIAENKNNPHIRKFSTNEDVISLAESGAEGQKSLCFESYANQRNEFISATIPLGYGMQLIIEMKSKYFAAGIFFNLKTFSSTFAQGLTWNDLSSDYPQYVYQNYAFYLKMTGRRKYKERCGTDTGYYTWSAEASGAAGVTLQSYQGSKGLNRYQLVANVFFMYNGQWRNITEITSLVPGSTLGQTGNNYPGYYFGVTYGY